MPRSGGESDKLGNRYEGLWTIGRLLELASGESDAVTIEPFGDDSLGIEFVSQRPDGGGDYHSAKRQRAQGEWSLAVLAHKDTNTGRSILTDLFGKIAAADRNSCCFVSSTGANDFRELTERAQQRKAFVEFEADLKGDASNALRSTFEKYIQPLTGDWESAYKYLRRTRVTLIDEATLRRQVEQHISFLIYRPDSGAFAPSEVRVLLGDFILDHLGTVIRQSTVWEFLAEFGYARRDWASDPVVRDVVRRQNQAFVRTVETELINGARMPRTEARSIVNAATRPSGAKTVLTSAAAGVGKSCVIAQSVEMLNSVDVPILVVRLDRHGDAHSTQEIGNQMELPRSPAIVLAAIANGHDSVLLVDQLDAVSQASGRYPHLWEVFEVLCQEAAAYPNMRIVVVCRDFDLDNDSRLRKLKQSQNVEHIKIGLLSVTEVDAALAAGDCAATSLTSTQKEILRTPLHLFLLLDSVGDGPNDFGFANIGELFDRYWNRKQRAVMARWGDESGWAAVMDTLCDTMSRGLTVYAPDIVLDGHAGTRAAMLTEHVLVQDGSKLRFFHESFFDYAFARRFCATGGNLTALLLSGEQHLFRRSQVRQILAFMRDHMREPYLRQLRELLMHANVRFHIKRLILAWLGTVADPTAEEWPVVDALLVDNDLQRHALSAVRNSLAWCDVLLQLGIIKNWLASPDQAVVDRGVWFLLFDQMERQRSEVTAELLAPYLGRNADWTKRLRAYFSFGNAHRSHLMQELFLRLVDDGGYDENSKGRSERIWHDLHSAGKDAPRFALEAILHWLDRRIDAAGDSLDDDALDLRDFDQSAVRLIADVARAEPGAFADEILPRVMKVVRLTEMPSRGLRVDKVWGWLNNSAPMRISAALLYELACVLEDLARQSPQKLEAKFASLHQTDSHTITFLLLRAWTANPEHFGSQCVRFLVADPRRLEVGYSSWSGGGNGHAAITREAIQACIPYATTAEREQLERGILRFSSPGDGDRADWIKCLLLESFGEQHLTEGGRKRLTALRARFPEQAKKVPPRVDAAMAKCVGSPIPPDEAQRFNDDQWLSAMREFDYGWDSPGPARELSGSAIELSRVLQPLAQRDRRRFAALALRMEDSIRSEYFEAILDGICGLENLPVAEKEKDQKDFEQLETDVVLSVVRRLHQLPNRPCGRSICRAFEKLASRSIKDAELQILMHYAVDDLDPKADDWKESASERKRDIAEVAHFHGYNSVRGHAARTIRALLFADYSRSPVLLPLVRAVVRDRSLAVRTCAVEALLPMLERDRDEAVRLFLDACDGAESVIGSHPFENFIRYATSTHYSLLRELLDWALQSASASTVKTAARQICLAAFADEAAAADVESVRNGTESMRYAAAEVYAHNLGDGTIGHVCRQYLPQFFDDDSKEVRSVAGDCFSHLGDVDLNNFVELIRTYIESPAFPSQHDDLLRRLDESTWQLPDITIRIAERFLAEFGAAAGDISTAAAGDAPTVSKLVIRLYSQSNDDASKQRCLDLIDEMERLGCYGIDSQLAELDR